MRQLSLIGENGYLKKSMCSKTGKRFHRKSKNSSYQLFVYRHYIEVQKSLLNGDKEHPDLANPLKPE